MNYATIISLLGLAIILFGIIAVLIGWRITSTAEMDRRIQEYIVEPSSTLARWPIDTLTVRRPELRGSFMSRTIIPMFRGVLGFFGRFTPKRSMDSLDRQLTTAGNPYHLGAREFYGIWLVCILLGAGIGYLFYTRLSQYNLLVGLMAFAILAFLPRVWLRGRVRRRRTRIQRNLPDALDMLSVCADAGLGFDQSLQRVSESWNTDLAGEFGRVVKEMSLGVSRSTALRDMAQRLDVQEISSFVAVILQSEQLGMSIADTLHSQATQMRIERRYWAQEQARKLPVKMLFPLMFLIMPALFVVVLGPALPGLLRVFSAL